MGSIDVGYVERGSVTWASTVITHDDDEPEEEPNEQPNEQQAPEPNLERSRDGGDDGDDDEGREEVAVAEAPAAAAAVASHHGGQGVEEQKEGEPGGQQERGSSGREAAAASTDGTDGSDRNDDGVAGGTPAKDEENARRGFSFATELFFLTHRALQVIVSPLERRRGEMQRILDSTALQRHGISLSGGKDGSDEAAAAAAAGGGGGAYGRVLGVYKEARSAISHGWALEGFGSDAVTGLGCQLANFTKSWLGLYVSGGGGVLASFPSAPSSLSVAEEAAAAFSKITPTLIETMCAAWVRAASNGRENKFLSRRAAEDAAVFCGEVMERVSSKALASLSEKRASLTRVAFVVFCFRLRTLLSVDHESSAACFLLQFFSTMAARG